jgi:hypothetical protein
MVVVLISATVHYSPEQWALAGSTALGAIGSFVTVIFNAKRGKRAEQKLHSIDEAVNNAELGSQSMSQNVQDLHDRSGDMIPEPPKKGA